MIYRARTMNLLAGKADAVRAVSLRAAAYANTHYPGIHVEILENIAGIQDQIHMVTRCESLAALEAYEAKRSHDPGWLAFVTEVTEIQGTTDVVDNLYRVLPTDAHHAPEAASEHAKFDTNHIPIGTPLLEDIEADAS